VTDLNHLNESTPLRVDHLEALIELRTLQHLEGVTGHEVYLAFANAKLDLALHRLKMNDPEYYEVMMSADVYLARILSRDEKDNA